MRALAANVLSLLIVAGLIAVAALVTAQRDYAAPGLHTDPVRVTIERGATISDASRAIADAGALPNRAVWGLFDGAALMRMVARSTGAAAGIRFGDYEIPAGASMAQIVALLQQGGNVRNRITIPEGLAVWEIVQRLNQEPLLTGTVETLPPEGSLAPDTYEIDRGATRQSVIDRMIAAQARTLDEAWAGRAEGLPYASPEEALIMASIVEKETALPEERPRVASVFVNRLRRGMRLQTDPTVIYGITGGKGPLGRALRRSELNEPTPYNTYVIAGLPPTPIANPGRESIRATLNPARTNFLYFVADGTGGHAFATNLADHNRNVAAWRRIERERIGNQ